MKEQLVTFETAKLAKEKGFNWETIHVYSEYDTFRQRVMAPTIRMVRQRSQKERNLAAPTQSLLQRWLREKHETFVTIVPHVHKTKLVWTSYLELRNKDIQVWNTYEEALEKGLKQALKFIS